VIWLKNMTSHLRATGCRFPCGIHTVLPEVNTLRQPDRFDLPTLEGWKAGLTDLGHWILEEIVVYFMSPNLE